MCMSVCVCTPVCASVSSCVTAASAAIISFRTWSLGCGSLCVSALISQSVTQTAAAHLPACHVSPVRGWQRIVNAADWTAIFFTIPPSLHLPSSVVCLHIAMCVSAPSYLPPFIHSVPVVTADSALSNVPAAAGSSIIKRLRRIEIISIRALR